MEEAAYFPPDADEDFGAFGTLTPSATAHLEFLQKTFKGLRAE
jgi:hypothetical protein